MVALTPKKGLILSLIGALVIWGFATRPLISNFTSAIPCHDRTPENALVVRDIVPGDHLQLLYHFWLCRDMLAGKTPAFTNAYEFNRGDDEKLWKFDPYYVPFSLIYAAISPIFGHAAGWNVAGLFSVLLSALGFYLLATRFCKKTIANIAIAILLSAFPYRWITLLSGSPTGYGMSLVPLLLYGIDCAVRDKSLQGGIIAGLSLFFCYTSCLHVFYFATMFSPIWALFCFLNDESKSIKRTILALIPFAIFAISATLLSTVASKSLASSSMANGRTLKELALFSPILSGLVRWQTLGPSNHIFMGTGLILLVAFSVILAIKRAQKWVIFALSFAIFATVMLSLGTYGPLHALPIKLARLCIPKYTMIRQSAKIFCLMPSLLTVILAYASAQINFSKRWIKYASLLLLIATITEELLWLSPTLTRLPNGLKAYQDVAKSAANPRAAVIPLWPGDSHWSSIYEFGVIDTRIRLINGYSPSVPATYGEEVFARLDSLNGGVVTDNELDFLRTMGVNYIIFHEQPYPGKVSPFPSGIALRRLRENAALTEIAQSDGIIAFAINGKKATTSYENHSYLDYPASFQWPEERLKQFKLRLRAPVPAAPNMRYMILASGGGELIGDKGTHIIVPEQKSWIEVPLILPMGENFEITEGASTFHYALVVAGTQDTNFTKHTWPASALFHVGYSAKDGSVTFAPSRTDKGVVLYGPDLPLPPGTYSIFSDPPSINFGNYSNPFFYDGLSPFRFELLYDGKTNLTVKSITLQKLPQK